MANPNTEATRRALAIIQARRAAPSAQRRLSPDEFKRSIASYGPQQAPEETDFDKFIRPVSNVLNGLAAGGYGFANVASQGIDRVGKADQLQRDGAGFLNKERWASMNPLNMVGDFADGAGKALTGRAAELDTFSDVIEKGTDVMGARDANYVDTKDNVNPWVKGIAGFVGDVALDPITYLPGGAILSVARGASKAAKVAAKATQGSDFTKTVAAGKAAFAPSTAMDSLAGWATRRSAEKADKKLIKQNTAEMKAGSASPQTVEWMVQNAPGVAKKFGHATAEVVDETPGSLVEDVNAEQLATIIDDVPAPAVKPEPVRNADGSIPVPAAPAPAKPKAARRRPTAKEAEWNKKPGGERTLLIQQAVQNGDKAFLRWYENMLKRADLDETGAAATGAAKLDEIVEEPRPLPDRAVDDPSVDPAASKAIDDANDVAELSVRARAAERMGDSTTAALAALPTNGSADILKTVRKLTYDKAYYPQKIQQNIRGLGPRPVRPKGLGHVAPKDPEGAAAYKLANTAHNDAASAWATKVEAIFGDRGATIKTLQNIVDPKEFKLKAAMLASKKVQGDYKDVEPAKIFAGLAQKGRAHNEEQLAALAKTLGLNKRNWGSKSGFTSWQDFFRGKSDVAASAYTRAMHAEKANMEIYKSLGVPDADAIEALAKTVEPTVAMGEAATTLIRDLEQVPLAWGASFMRLFGLNAKGAYGIGKSGMHKRSNVPQNQWTDVDGEAVISNKNKKQALEGMGDKGTIVIKTHIWEGNKTQGFGTGLLGDFAKLAEGMTPAAREEFGYKFIMAGYKFLDTRLRSIGVTALSASHKTETNYLKHASGEYAFLGMSDVLAALPKGVVKAVLVSGKNRSILPTFIHDAGRWVLKLSEENNLDPASRMAVLAKYADDAVKRIPLVNGKKISSAKFMESTEGRNMMLGLLKALDTPESIAKLTQAHIRNGAFAKSMGSSAAHRMTDASAKVLMGALRAPHSSTGSIVDGLSKSMDDFRNTVKREGMTDSDAAIMGQHDLEQLIAQSLSITDAKAARAAIRMASAAKGTKTTAQVQAKADEIVEAMTSNRTPEGKPKPPKAAKKTPASVTEAAAIKGAVNTERVSQLRVIAPEIEEYMDAAKNTDEILNEADRVMTLDTARANATMGLPGWMMMGHKIGETMSGGFGFRDLKAGSIGQELSARHAGTQFANAVAKFSKQYGREVTDGAWAILRKVDSNDQIEAALEGVDAGIAQATRELWPMMSTVFDHSEHNLFARMGHNADYINEFLVKMGVDQDYLLAAGEEGVAVGKQWKAWEFDELHDPMANLANYYKGMQQASVVPNIAASFANDFGHKSSYLAKAMTDSEARAAGWVRVQGKPGVKDKTGGLGEWLDPEQYYDPAMLEQLGMLDQYLGKSKILNQDKVFDKVFRHMDHVVNAMKASVTVWRPGHHVTNVTGEALFNTLAGVWNPMRYSDALRVMSTQGLIDGKSGDQMLDTLRKLAPEGFKLREAENGIKMTIGGQTRRIAPDSIFQMFDKSGIVLHHTVAEDFLNESAELMGRKPSPLAAASKLFQPHWLGNLSANRDNAFRLAHAIDLLGKKNYRSVDEAMTSIAREIHSFHPSMQTLSAVEQKYVRRYIYFYTWQRQALSRVVESMIDTPGRILVAPKAIYNASEAMGADPQSIGQPMPNDPRLPSYSAGNITAALWNVSPEGSGNLDLWGANINAPQLDILQSVFGSAAINPDMSPGDQLGDSVSKFVGGAVLQNLTPLIKAPAELGTMARFGSGTPIRDRSEYLLDQTGLRVPSVLGAFGERSDVRDSELERQEGVDRTIFNWLTGAKLTHYTTPRTAASADAQRSKEMSRMMKEDLR